MTVRKSQDVAREAIAKNEVVYHNKAGAQPTVYDAIKPKGLPPVDPLDVDAMSADRGKTGRAKCAKGAAEAARRKESEGAKSPEHDHGVNGAQTRRSRGKVPSRTHRPLYRSPSNQLKNWNQRRLNHGHPCSANGCVKVISVSSTANVVSAKPGW